MENRKIDIVLTWVDGNDPKWQKEKSNYERMEKKGRQSENDTRDVRYREWDNIQYIFRGIEKYMPWVNKVHFVTWGHIPIWLNTKCEKLQIVNHRDFIPEKYLPTFNSNTIELNLHRIPGLAEQFINFNDDMFVIGKTEPRDFFINGKPKDMAVISPPPIFRDTICNIETNNMGIINEYYSIADIRRNSSKWYSLKYGKFLLRTILFSHFRTIIGLYEPHIPFSHLKSTMIEVWDREKDFLENVCMHKFRSNEDVNEWLFRQWQLMSGNFEPRRWDFGLLLSAATDCEKIISLLYNPGKLRFLCVNDTPEMMDFENKKKMINDALQKVLPEKCIFER